MNLNNIKIVVVDDNIVLSRNIQNIIRELGCIVFNITSTFEKMKIAIEEIKPDLIIMDIYFNNMMDSVDIAEELRKKINIPIIFLTSYYDKRTLIRAFNINPEAYLIKPFKDEDLKVSVLLALHKNSNVFEQSSKKRICNDYYFNEKNNELYYKGEIVRLGKKEKKLLKLLINENGDFVKFEKLEEEIYSIKPVSSSSLRTLLYRLRKKFNNKLIETIPYYGCRIIIKAE